MLSILNPKGYRTIYNRKAVQTPCPVFKRLLESKKSSIIVPRIYANRANVSTLLRLLLFLRMEAHNATNVKETETGMGTVSKSS